MNVVSKFIYRTKEYGLKYVLQTIVRNKIFTRIEVLNDTIGSFLFKRIPLKETIILESHNDFDSNGGAFYDYLIKHNFNEKNIKLFGFFYEITRKYMAYHIMLKL